MAHDRVRVMIEGGVADLRLNRPGKPSALEAMVDAIAATGATLAEASGLGVVVLSGGRIVSGEDTVTLGPATRAPSFRDP